MECCHRSHHRRGYSDLYSRSPGQEPDVPGEARLPGQQRQGLSAAVHRPHCRKPEDRQWQAVWIENEFLRVMVLPEIGGRIHVVQDKTNGYDFIYRQPVIKPALVGLAGPWISGGIEFNWPQHHRPGHVPAGGVCQIEEHADGSKTVWCSDHDPMARMKGMHGVCLHPGKAYVELKVRAYNRTPLVADVSLVGQRRPRASTRGTSRFFRRTCITWPTTPGGP